MAPWACAFAKRVLVRCGMLVALGGCSWMPVGQDRDKADSGKADAAPEREDCSLRAQACANRCLDRGSKCTDCCTSNADACDRGDHYSFSSCPDAE